MEPHVPLVEGEVDVLLLALARAHIVAHRHDLLDELVHIVRARQEGSGVVLAVAIVLVQRHVVHSVIRLAQHGGLPLGEGGHVQIRRAAADQLYRGIDPLHYLAGLVCYAAIFIGGLVTHLPGAVHLVAQTPQLYAVRLLPAVADAQVAQVRAGGMVAVLNYVARLIHAARAKVDRHHDLGVRHLSPVAELVYAHLIWLGRGPCQIKALGTLIARAYAVLPAIAGHEVAARIAGYRHVQLAHEVNHVAAEALLIGGGMTRLIYAAIHRAPQMLYERTEHALIYCAYAEVLIHYQLCLLHFSNLLECSSDKRIIYCTHRLVNRYNTSFLVKLNVLVYLLYGILKCSSYKVC